MQGEEPSSRSLDMILWSPGCQVEGNQGERPERYGTCKSTLSQNVKKSKVEDTTLNTQSVTMLGEPRMVILISAHEKSGLSTLHAVESLNQVDQRTPEDRQDRTCSHSLRWQIDEKRFKQTGENRSTFSNNLYINYRTQLSTQCILLGFYSFYIMIEYSIQYSCII